MQIAAKVGFHIALARDALLAAATASFGRKTSFLREKGNSNVSFVFKTLLHDMFFAYDFKYSKINELQVIEIVTSGTQSGSVTIALDW